ncbi:MAG: GGDEF domain-containing protein [Flavobacteriaceae bacterium]|nr:MAG: GGDEF domain-containing protein [Flavobacteriaceae bacterium]
MTLSKQLIALISGMFLLIFAGTFWISVENTRSYLMLQLVTQTQNVADSFGLSLASHMQRKDIAAVDTMVNAVFDSGYYKSLTLTDISGKILVERENTAQIEGVPAWFIHRLTLETPQVESIITTGWMQTGRLILVAHPGLAYEKLWQTTLQTFWWSVAAFVLSLIAVLLLLRSILRPLKAVEQQALAICDREFPVQEKIPNTRELKRVVLAMNKMSKKLYDFIHTLSSRAEKMHKEAYEDALTGLRNRRAFNTTMESILHGEKEEIGSLVIVRMSDFADYNKQHGVQAGNELLIDIAKNLHEISIKYSTAEVFRMSGTDFSMLLPNTDLAIADEVGQSLSDTMNTLAMTHNIEELAHIGIALFKSDYQMSEVLADADAALASARYVGVNSYVVQKEKSEALGNDAWKSLIEHTLSHKNIELLGQAVFNQLGEVLYNEVFIRIRDKSGKTIAPGVFVSMADRLGLSEQLDKLVIMQATEWVEKNTTEHGVLAVNLSADSISRSSFRDWLMQHFDKYPDLGSRLMFEISEQGLMQYVESAKDFINLLHSKDSQVVMEHFGTRLSSFQTLRQLKVDFIKMSGSYTRDIASHGDNRFFLQTVTDIAHGLDIKVIAEQVETENEAKVLGKIGIHLMQGYYFGVLEPLR